MATAYNLYVQMLIKHRKIVSFSLMRLWSENLYRVGDGFPLSGSKTEGFVIKFRMGKSGAQQVEAPMQN